MIIQLIIYIADIGLSESRRLEIRCGLTSKEQVRKVYVHMLNGTLCATERALCCLVENHQTPEVRKIRSDFLITSPQLTERQGLAIPKVLQPYMQGRTFLPWVKELPKSLQRKQA